MLLTRGVGVRVGVGATIVGTEVFVRVGVGGTIEVLVARLVGVAVAAEVFVARTVGVAVATVVRVGDGVLDLVGSGVGLTYVSVNDCD